MFAVHETAPEEEGESEEEGEGEVADVADRVGDDESGRVVLDGDELHDCSDDGEWA